ncbi:MAG: ABC transporter substrate-binding protein [Pacificimonas sp.]|jgi:oligopeptide transport system substrate-binding protein|nr:ABC transporter substrate-binding protein [Pacificimonas sp.]
MNRLNPMPAILALLVFILLAACEAGEEAEMRTTRITFIADEGLDASPRNQRERFVEAASHVGLTAYAADGRIVPGLATSWRVLDDGRTYVFKLREAYWPDNRQITAGDVVAVLRRQVAPGGTSPWSPWLRDIEGAIAVSANRAPARMLRVEDPLPDVVTIELSQQSPNLLGLLAQPSLAIIRAREDPPPPSGAFETGRQDDGSVVLRPNFRWYDRDIDAPQGPLLVTPAADEETAIGWFEAGQTDAVIGGTTSGLFRIRTEELAPALRLSESWGLYGYVVRVTEGSPLADIRVRQALSMSLDRTALIANTFALSGMQPAYGPLPPTLPPAYAGAVPDWAVWAQPDRVAEARRLLAEAGYGPENRLMIDVAIPRGEAHRRLLAAIADQWVELGVRVRGYRRTPAGHRRAIEAGEFDLAAVERLSPLPIAGLFLRPFSCDVRIGGFCDPDADSLMAEADGALDLAVRIDRTRRAARLLADDAAIIPLFSPVRWMLVRPGVEGLEANIAGVHPPRTISRTG